MWSPSSSDWSFFLSFLFCLHDAFWQVGVKMELLLFCAVWLAWLNYTTSWCWGDLEGHVTLSPFTVIPQKQGKHRLKWVFHSLCSFFGGCGSGVENISDWQLTHKMVLLSGLWECGYKGLNVELNHCSHLQFQRQWLKTKGLKHE